MDTPSESRAETPRADIVPSKKVELPPFYQAGTSDFMQRAQDMDPDFSHRWVNVSPRNQTMKVWKGYLPITDKAKLSKLGLSDLVNSRGRAQYMDTELWARPRAQSVLVHAKINEDLARRSTSVRAALAAEAEQTSGQSQGKAVPFITTGQEVTGDILDRQPAPGSKPNTEK